jgi:hypothetical protein
LLKISRTIKDEPSRVEALVSIAPNLSESEKIDSIKEALEFAKAIGVHNLRSDMLAKISHPLSELPIVTIYPIWQELHHILARRYRGDLLWDISALTPLILALGGIEALEQSSHAIQDVSKWWP